MADLIIERRHLSQANRLIAEGTARILNFKARLQMGGARTPDASSLSTLALLRISLETFEAHRRQILIAIADLKTGRV
ncbi:hypothetical protein [Variovorax sp. LG9.2]|uniref:hypothetical protein n=1 Tax=Variovorax sp. LG9.2 TaxID=3048626 RepID=UPI002B2279C3|nr:hypothetical protein [Variovorax sp. LG9.2]MEB0059712.1 hypothetical protein [Variovorax sp. LG9.2]